MKRRWGSVRAPGLSWGDGAPSRDVPLVPVAPSASGRAGSRPRAQGRATPTIVDRSSLERSSASSADACQSDSRGSAATARAIAADPARLDVAVKSLTRDFFSTNGAAVKKSKRELAEELAKLAGFDPVYPLSVELVIAVGAALKAAGYRSAPSYIGELKLRHVEENYPVGPALARAIKLANDSSERGIGPVNKAPEVPLEAFDFTVQHDEFILGAADSYVVAVNWLLREIELAAIEVSPRRLAFKLVGECEALTLFLPTSKTDQSGQGAARTLAHECQGSGGYVLRSIDTCPVCAVKRQLDRLKANWGKPRWEDLEPLQLPLFPTPQGDKPSKATVVAAWTACLRAEAQPPTPAGHSARRTGAKRRAKMGWSLWQIQFMGRWAASTVVDYVEEAMAEMTATWSMASSSASATHSASAQPATPGASGNALTLLERIDTLESLLDQIRNASSVVTKPEPLTQADLTSNSHKLAVVGSRAHRIDESVLEWPRTLWVTSCGWRCGDNYKLKIFSPTISLHSSVSLCARPGCWASRPEGK